MRYEIEQGRNLGYLKRFLEKVFNINKRPRQYIDEDVDEFLIRHEELMDSLDDHINVW